MVFSSITFLLFFLPAFLIIYGIVPKKWKNYVILFSSILFYSWGAPQFIFILLASTFVDFYIVRYMSRTDNPILKRRLVATSIILNLGLLTYFKYSNFFVENINTALNQFGIEGVAWTAVVLPIAISFYTFQTLTYSIDVYRKVHKPLDKVQDYILYIIMFPQLIAGPIVRYNEIAGQITNRIETYDDKLLGFYRFCIGLAKKVLIANVLGEQADTVMAMDANELSTLTAWIGILAYTFQIYFDFSGYSDMAIGLGRMMGFSFPENFRNPYCSKSITEFWQRWHITLGAFMRDYLYIPLGGNRVTKKRLYFNLWFVFVLSGIWHGASWNFILWGIYHGLFLVIERLFLSKVLNKLGYGIGLIYAFFITTLGWVIFRIEDTSQALSYYGKLFCFTDGIDIRITLKFKIILSIAIFFSFFILLPFGQRVQDYFFHKKQSKRMAIARFITSWTLFALCIAALSTSSFNPFIYFRF